MPRLCARFWARIWEKSDAWDRAASNRSELWDEETAENRALLEAADALHDSDPAAAFPLYLEAADAGSTFALEVLAWHYRAGTVVAADFAKAQDYLCRAIEAGSWMATIDYARFLANHGFHDDSEAVLNMGVEAGFVPSFYWLAYLRQRRCKSRAVYREIRPMLEYAASKGHPGAQVELARLMVLGKFGLSEIPSGLAATARLARHDIRGGI